MRLIFLYLLICLFGCLFLHLFIYLCIYLFLAVHHSLFFGIFWYYLNLLICLFIYQYMCFLLVHLFAHFLSFFLYLFICLWFIFWWQGDRLMMLVLWNLSIFSISSIHSDTYLWICLSPSHPLALPLTYMANIFTNPSTHISFDLIYLFVYIYTCLSLFLLFPSLSVIICISSLTSHRKAVGFRHHGFYWYFSLHYYFY